MPSKGARKGNAPPIHELVCNTSLYGRGVPLVGALDSLEMPLPLYLQGVDEVRGKRFVTLCVIFFDTALITENGQVGVDG